MDAATMRQIELEDALRYAARRREEDALLGCPDPAPITEAPRLARRRERLTPFGVATPSGSDFDTPLGLTSEQAERLASGDINTSVRRIHADGRQEVVATNHWNGRIAGEQESPRQAATPSVAVTAEVEMIGPVRGMDWNA